MSRLAVQGLSTTAAFPEAAQEDEAKQIFLAKFPPLPRQSDFPPITWAEIERQLVFPGGVDPARPPWEIDTLRKQAAFQTPEQTLQALLMLAWSIIDDSRDAVQAREGPMI